MKDQAIDLAYDALALAREYRRPMLVLAGLVTLFVFPLYILARDTGAA